MFSPKATSGLDARVQCITDIAKSLVKAYDERANVNILKLRQSAASKYGLGNTPKLMEIIAGLYLLHFAICSVVCGNLVQPKGCNIFFMFCSAKACGQQCSMPDRFCHSWICELSTARAG